jgi:cutinase
MVANVSRAAQIEQAFSLCPDTKLISSGYSQGAQLVHKSAALLPADVAEWITAVVVFGDPGMPQINSRDFDLRLTCCPDDGQAISNVAASKVDTFCNTGDDICQDGIIITVEHLIYAEDASAAASFVVSL